MLIEFSVTNFKAFKDTQTLKLSLDRATKGLMENIHKKSSLLKSAFIYGPNASGKSTLIEALRLMRFFIIESARTQRGDEINWAVPFRLNSETLEQPTVFEATFILQSGIKYEYGFAATKTRVMEEWLLEYRSQRPTHLFKRSYNPRKKETKWDFKGGLRPGDIHKRTLENTLFLSKAAQENHEYLAPVFDWFRQNLVVQSAQRDNDSIIRNCMEGDFNEKKKKILHFLQDADVGITDLQILKTHEQLGRLQSVHIMQNTSRPVEFDFLNDESDGTISMLALASYLIDASTHSHVFVIDELDKSLHPLLIRELLLAFHKFTKNSQLIFTTHNIQHMDEELFRKDQIWFMEKNRPSESSSLFRLSDLKGIRKEHAFERRYLHGAYGALPILGKFDLGSK
ncbi:MAG: ATP-binding protein [Rhabdochlamydiaceae bacterium]|jgi:AAA15 family ATPase/GTPase